MGDGEGLLTYTKFVLHGYKSSLCLIMVGWLLFFGSKGLESGGRDCGLVRCAATDFHALRLPLLPPLVTVEGAEGSGGGGGAGLAVGVTEGAVKFGKSIIDAEALAAASALTSAKALL